MGAKFSGQKIKFFRKKIGLTQAELADRISVNINTLAKWERTEQCPSVDNASTLAQALGVSINDFFENEDKEQSLKIANKHSESLHAQVGTQTMTFRNGEQEFTMPYDRELSLQILGLEHTQDESFMML